MGSLVFIAIVFIINIIVVIVVSPQAASCRRLPRSGIFLEGIFACTSFQGIERSRRDGKGAKSDPRRQAGRKAETGLVHQDERYAELAELLRDCLAFNLLEKAYIPQGKKGQMWTVYYVNNWLCAYARLPLRRGGWRKLSLHQLTKWL
jgi:hypothetical protein